MYIYVYSIHWFALDEKIYEIKYYNRIRKKNKGTQKKNFLMILYSM